MVDSGNIFHVALPVTAGERHVSPQTFTLKGLYGTAFPIGGGLVLTADHVVRNARATGYEMLVGTNHRGSALSHDTDLHCSWADVDIAALRVDDIDDIPPLNWTARPLATLEAVRALGFAFGFEPQHGSVVARGFAGHIAAVRPFYDLPGRPPVYELGFAAPSGLSGAALLRGDSSVICGCVIGNRTTEMNVLSHVEIVSEDDGKHHRTERVERRDYLHLGIAIRSEAILELMLPEGNTVREHVEARGAKVGVAPVSWRVNGFRDGHCTTPEGDSEIAPPWSIVDPEVTVRSPVSWDRS